MYYIPKIYKFICFLCFVHNVRWVFANDLEYKNLETINTIGSFMRKYVADNSGFIYGEGQLSTDLSYPHNEFMKNKRTRVRRQTGGKFTEASKMPQIKLMRLILQMMKNIWAPVYVGGTNPFHPEVPKPIVYLFKDKVMEFFFPEVGEVRQKKAKKV